MTVRCTLFPVRRSARESAIRGNLHSMPGASARRGLGPSVRRHQRGAASDRPCLPRVSRRAPYAVSRLCRTAGGRRAGRRGNPSDASARRRAGHRRGTRESVPHGAAARWRSGRCTRAPRRRVGPFGGRSQWPPRRRRPSARAPGGRADTGLHRLAARLHLIWLGAACATLGRARRWRGLARHPRRCQRALALCARRGRLPRGDRGDGGGPDGGRRRRASPRGGRSERAAHDREGHGAAARPLRMGSALSAAAARALRPTQAAPARHRGHGGRGHATWRLAPDLPPPAHRPSR